MVKRKPQLRHIGYRMFLDCCEKCGHPPRYGDVLFVRWPSDELTAGSPYRTEPIPFRHKRCPEIPMEDIQEAVRFLTEYIDGVDSEIYYHGRNCSNSCPCPDGELLSSAHDEARHMLSLIEDTL